MDLLVECMRELLFCFCFRTPLPPLSISFISISPILSCTYMPTFFIPFPLPRNRLYDRNLSGSLISALPIGIFSSLSHLITLYELIQTLTSSWWLLILFFSLSEGFPSISFTVLSNIHENVHSIATETFPTISSPAYPSASYLAPFLPFLPPLYVKERNKDREYTCL